MRNTLSGDDETNLIPVSDAQAKAIGEVASFGSTVVKEVGQLARYLGRILGTIPEDAVGIVIEMRGLKQVSDSGTIEKMVDDVIAANPKSVEEYKAGKDKAFNALFGQVMKASNKTANPAQVTEILQRKLRP